ncbi:hypothetical protein BCR32DRAFT_273169 [Anaeromyces robustus]|jgi:hypothetical protein|uniref:Ankyrin repeat domain-containing protein n=1 Tax=Anaeromyces robustus TaxID=1754192 RepID=A0A1Y1VTD1_9FUNG|nr:hypothetical protein BCR32DRAFT_273169 [Anaeromyces robustus]|eukprot:ORX64276.1 hypothetical protein BCR32DRAFT_273169 [Anaeromyces robustus]
MSDLNLKTYPLHRCIYRNDVKNLEKLLKEEKYRKIINEKDNHGNAPIHLALMLNRHHCLMVLLKCKESNPFILNNKGWSPINEASVLNDVDALELIYRKIWKVYEVKVDEKDGFYDQINKTAPNVYLKFKIKIKTSIPLLKRLNTTVYLTMLKNKKSMKHTITIGGVDMRGVPKIIKGNMSLLIKLDEKRGSRTIYAVNNEKKLYQELYPHVPDYYLAQSINSNIGATKLINVHPDFSNTVIKPKKGGILKNNYKGFSFESGKIYRAVAYKVKNVDLMIYNRIDEGIIGENESIIKVVDEREISKKSKKQESKFIIDCDDTKSINNTEPDSDPEPDYDSDSDSDCGKEEEYSKQERKNMITEDDAKLLNYFDKDKGKKKTKEEIEYTVTKDGKTKTFMYETTQESTLDWEEAYHEKYSKGVDLVYGVLGIKEYDNRKVKRYTPQEIENLNLHKITEEEYFNPASTKPLHMGRIMEVSEEKKTFKRKIRLWMAKDSSEFPVTLKDIEPLLRYFAITAVNPSLFYESEEEASKETSTAKLLDYNAFKFLTTALYDSFEEKNTFPLKIIIPLYPSVNLEIKTVDCSIDEKYVQDCEFEIPSDYSPGNVYFERIEK